MRDDSVVLRSAKAACLLLLLSSFSCEIACVFIGQVTGDAVQSNGDAPESKPRQWCGASCYLIRMNR